jgi:hypothetical protein
VRVSETRSTNGVAQPGAGDPRRNLALCLAAVQAVDLIVTSTSSRYGEPHLEHLGVPRALRPWLPVIKTVAVIALAGSSASPRLRTAVGHALFAYYAAATAFHVLSGDGIVDLLPAATCAAAAAALAAAPPADSTRLR